MSEHLELSGPDGRQHAAPPVANPAAGEGKLSEDYVLAGIAARTVCRLFDVYLLPLLATAFLLVGFFAALPFLDEATLDDFDRGLGSMPDMYFILPAILAWTVQDAFGGVSIGKWVAGFRVVSIDHVEVSWRQAFWRSVLLILDSFFLGVVGLSAMSKSSLRQRVGDRQANTVVINYRKSGGDLRPPTALILKGLIGSALVYAAILGVLLLLYMTRLEG